MSDLARRVARKARNAPRRLKREVDVRRARSAVADSGYFDASWYLRHYPELIGAGVTDPLDHYVRWGAREGRSPGPDFEADGYRLLNPSAAEHPLLHYLARSHRGASLPPPEHCIDPDHPVLRSGWFDADWYRAMYADEARSDIHPLVDYVWHGVQAGRHPGPVFHGPRYGFEFPEYHSERSPVHHFLAHGRAEHCFPTGIEQPGTSALEGELLTPRLMELHDVGPRIAVVIHAFHVDVLHDLVECVATLPSGAHLFIAVRDTADAARARTILDQMLGTAAPADIRVVPNRGRNFGPLLFEFNTDVLRHDYVLHLHTKKSEHLGGPGDHWRRHQSRSLAGSPAISEMVLSTFESMPSVGVVQPSPYWQLPYWVCHWLGNGRLGGPLLARLGIDAPAHGWVDYPVGGMFWARVEAIRPLLEAGFHPDEFEAEPAGTDGTLAHAIERVITITARSQGFDAVEFDRATAQWRRNWSSRNMPKLEELPIEAMRDRLRDADLISVDLFDTLVLRPTLSPTALQYFAARSMLDSPGASTAVQDRLAAEASARELPIHPGDVTLAEIAAHLDERRPDARRLVELERAIEHACAVPRPSLVALLREVRAAGSRVVLMTDTTLPRPDIEQLLRDVGCDDLFDDLYISNEVGARKDTGTMWALVEAVERAPRDRWVHLGDNVFSDMQRPAMLGIGHLHVPAPAEVAQAYGFTGSLPDRSIATKAVVGNAVVRLFGEFPAEWPLAQRLGHAGLGPLLAAFVSWLAGHPAIHDVDHLLYVARDGALPLEATQRLLPFLPSALGNGKYFLCSRRTALAIASADELALDLVLAGNFRGTLRALLLERTGLDLDHPELERSVQLPNDLIACTAVLQEHAGIIQRHAHDELRGFNAYLRSLGIEPQHRIALVDLGYSATTQRALARVLPNEVIGLYAATSTAAEVARGEGLAVHSCFGDHLEWGQGHGILDHSMLLEALFAADHGQVERFDVDERGVRVRLKAANRRSPAEWAEVRCAQEAAIAFCTELVDRFGPAILTEPIDPDAALEPWQHLLSTRTSWADRLFRDLFVDDQFTGFGRAPVR